VGQELFDSVTNIGNRPTFGAESFAIETHLLDFHPVDLSEDTESGSVFFFCGGLRPEIKFSSPEGTAGADWEGCESREAVSEIGGLFLGVEDGLANQVAKQSDSPLDP